MVRLGQRNRRHRNPLPDLRVDAVEEDDGKRKVPRLARRLLFAVVGGYAVYGLLYLSAANAKTPELREYYTSLHPLMRIGASTFLLFDREAVVTDLGRTAEDYRKMGLPVNETSLHFRLEDRFVHALDLRTTGRTELRNDLTAGYFRVMGFRTLRHVGTRTTYTCRCR